MPIFFQQDVDVNTRLAIWKIEEEESYFLKHVPLHRDITHPHKRLQHLAGRYLLKYLFPDFPTELIRIADTRKPFLENEVYHFSISHCGDYAAVIASSAHRVGIDIEIPDIKVQRILHKFLHVEEHALLHHHESLISSTVLWSAKESMFKWWGRGQVDFSDMLRLTGDAHHHNGCLDARFIKPPHYFSYPVHYRVFPGIVLAWVYTDAHDHHSNF